LKIDILKKLSINAILKKSNLFIRVDEFGVIEVSFEVGNVFVNILFALLVMFELFLSFLLDNLILEPMVKSSFEVSPGLTPVKGRTNNHEGQGDENLLFVFGNLISLKEKFDLLDL